MSASAHAARDLRFYGWLLAYEAKCAIAGVRVIRVFRRHHDAEQWLSIMGPARNFTGF